MVSGAQLGIVDRQNKLVQDIRLCLLEKMGTDNLHPSFGSLIEGGRTPDGDEVPGVIGESDLDLVILEVESEVTRIVRNYQRQQLTRAKQDKLVRGRATLDPEEVILELGGIDFQQYQDSLRVTIHVVTGTDTVSVTLPIAIPLTEAT